MQVPEYQSAEACISKSRERYRIDLSDLLWAQAILKHCLFSSSQTDGMMIENSLSLKALTLLSLPDADITHTLISQNHKKTSPYFEVKCQQFDIISQNMKHTEKKKEKKKR